ncbi:DUF4271 domain-containing protein [Lutibacter sp. HS1-25]|uniref:DUF4271 domain-containing protein n=1 Tax=Lutibacter sp. HS1-25 TaxID=2485000 RepID=UPI001010C008|nr:DUF4271 domain-containing protein [Lutibacter sp. HS1-25]RXP59470.1 DUF4271 domain-containing protein [Lutibacter sp. HS1-25]
MFEAKEIVPQNTDWIALVFFIILIILVVLKTMFKERLYHTSVLLFSKKYVSIYYNKDKIGMLNLFQGLFFVIQILVISLFLSVLYGFFQASLYDISLNMYLISLGVVSLYYCFRFVSGYLLSSVFNLKNIYRKVLFEKSNYTNSLILWVIVPILFLVYSKNYYELFLWITLVMFVGLLTVRYILLLKNNKSFLFQNLFYFILYLCALEIAPLVIILKLTI